MDSSTKSRKATGDHAEGVAARYLMSRGVRILERNVYNRGGEIDLIGQDSDTLVFFEVRYRGQGSLTSGAESVTPAKQKRLLKAIKYYLHKHGLWETLARIDVVAIAPGEKKQYQIQWIKNAIQA